MEEQQKQNNNKEKENPSPPSWNLSTLDKLKFSVILAKHDSFSKVFQFRYNLTKALDEELKRRTTGETHIILTLSGLTGSGKSTVAQFLASQKIAKHTGVPFDVDNIQFVFENLLERCKNIPPNSTIIADESILQTGIGSKRERLDIMNLENVVRKYGLNIIWVYPEENIRHPTAHLNLRTIAINKEYKYTKIALKYGEHFLGYAVLDVGKILNSELWHKYEKRKDEFIENILQRKQLRRNYYELAEQVLSEISSTEKEMCKGISNTILILRRLSWLPHLTEKEIETVARYILIIKKEEEI